MILPSSFPYKPSFLPTAVLIIVCTAVTVWCIWQDISHWLFDINVLQPNLPPVRCLFFSAFYAWWVQRTVRRAKKRSSGNMEISQDSIKVPSGIGLETLSEIRYDDIKKLEVQKLGKAELLLLHTAKTKIAIIGDCLPDRQIYNEIKAFLLERQAAPDSLDLDQRAFSSII